MHVIHPYIRHLHLGCRLQYDCVLYSKIEPGPFDFQRVSIPRLLQRSPCGATYAGALHVRNCVYKKAAARCPERIVNLRMYAVLCTVTVRERGGEPEQVGGCSTTNLDRTRSDHRYGRRHLGAFWLAFKGVPRVVGWWPAEPGLYYCSLSWWCFILYWLISRPVF